MRVSHIVSLGHNCQLTYQLRRYFNFATAFPFDWWVTNMRGVIDTLEGYLALTRPQELNRQNARVGNTAVVHFAYHGQMEIMDKSGLLAEYAKYAPPLGFETVGSFVPPPMDDVHKSMYHNILSAWSKNK